MNGVKELFIIPTNCQMKWSEKALPFSFSFSSSLGRDVIKEWMGDPRVKRFLTAALELGGERIIVEYS